MTTYTALTILVSLTQMAPVGRDGEGAVDVDGQPAVYG